MKRNNFRVARCLNNGVISKYAIFEDGSPKALIEENDAGDEYFCIQNPYAVPNPENGVKSYFNLHFYNMIKDAITAVREDYADAIQCKGQSTGGFIHVVRFVNEEVGKEYRKKTLAGWANTKFAYALRAGSKNSWSGYNLIGPNGEKLGLMSNTLKYRVFDTKEEAMKYGDELLEVAREYASRMVNAEDHEAAIHECFDEVNEKYGRFSIIEDFMADLVTGNADAYKNEQKVLEEYGYDTMQCIVPEREDVIENEWQAQASILWAGFKYHFEKLFSEWESNDIEKIIVQAFDNFYQNNKDVTNMSCKTDVALPQDVQEHLFEKWLKCVEENKDLLYPVA